MWLCCIIKPCLIKTSCLSSSLSPCLSSFPVGGKTGCYQPTAPAGETGQRESWEWSDGPEGSAEVHGKGG